MDSHGQMNPPNVAGKSYRAARIDHYLRQAENCFQMARYDAAKRVLDNVFTLDSANSAGKSLGRKIETQIGSLSMKGGPGDRQVARPAARKRPRDVVLIVDQDESVLTKLATRLRKFGFEPVSALNYQEAVETVKAVTPQLVISEVNFESGPAGFDLFLWMKTHLESKQTPFLFLATRIDRELMIAGRRFGVDDFLFKPVDEDVVAASVRNCIERARHPSP